MTWIECANGTVVNLERIESIEISFTDPHCGDKYNILLYTDSHCHEFNRYDSRNEALRAKDKLLNAMVTCKQKIIYKDLSTLWNRS